MKRFLISLAVLALSAGTAFSQVVDGRNFGIDGFAAYAGTAGTQWYHAGGTTGGEGGKVVKADTFSQLQAYLQSSNPYIILVDHDITTGIKCYVDDLSTGHLLDDQSGASGVETTYGERIMVASNKTLIGIADPVTGKAPLFSRITFVMQCTHNVIIRNCRFTMVGAPILKSGENKIVAWRDGQQVETGDPDCIGIQADAVSAKKDSGSHIWIDHCEFFNGGAANKDRYDGLLDCKNNVQWLTFSYNYFHNHDKSCLWGKGDSDVYEGCRTISAHHNMFENIDGSRLPLQRGGHVHYMNNFINGCADGYDLRSQAVGYIEGCYFKDTKAPICKPDGGTANLCQEAGYGIIYDNCRRVIKGTSNIDYINEPARYDEEITLATNSWVPTQTTSTYYVNSRDKAADVPELCQKYSGAGKIVIWSETVPAVDAEEFKAACQTQLTAGCYDEDGNKIAGINEGGNTGGGTGGDDPSNPSGTGTNYMTNCDSDGWYWFNQANATEINGSLIGSFITFTDGIKEGNAVACQFKSDYANTTTGTETSRTGAITIAQASANDQPNGGTMTMNFDKGLTCLQLALHRTGGYRFSVAISISGAEFKQVYSDTKSTKGEMTCDLTQYVKTSDPIQVRITNSSSGGLQVQGFKACYSADTSAITTIALPSASQCYDLQGRRIMSPVKGQMYIMGGKKFVQK